MSENFCVPVCVALEAGETGVGESLPVGGGDDDVGLFGF